MLNHLRKIRAIIIKVVKPKNGYFLFEPKKYLQPISRKHGFDRGTPIDRYYIDSFLEENKSYIKGACLEIHDNYYTKKFGRQAVTRSDALDVEKRNKQASIYGDLRKLDNIADGTYDCLVITHTIGLIDNYEAAISECSRILKIGGSLILVATVNGSIDPEADHWRFTPASAKHVFSKYFSPEKLHIRTYGNVLSGQAHWVGLAAEELSKEELGYNDPYYPILITVIAVK